MKNTIRCCISCILPCGALDVIRIVHVNGRVEEISTIVRANEVMKAHPKHILKKPTSRPSSSSEETRSSGPTIVVVPPDAQLQRGKIYFLIPVHDQTTSSKKKPTASIVAAASKKMMTSANSSTHHQPASSAAARRRRREQRKNSISVAAANNDHNNMILCNKEGDKYLSEILSEKVIVSSHKEKRRGRVNVWRPHLESITETLSEVASSSDQ